MSPLFYFVLHVVSVILLFALTFSAFADPRPERKKRLAMATGILALLVLVSGFGLVAKNPSISYTSGWLIVKMVVWLTVAALGGIVFRQPSKAGMFGWITAVLAAVAVYMVYLKPF